MRRIVISLVLVVASVGSASAECAWVLWSSLLTDRGSPEIGGRWRLG